jgi:cell division protein ZapA
MGQVTVTLNGRSYRLRCGEDEEQRLFALADHVRGKLDGLVQEFGQAGDDRLLLMAALLISDELFDAREELESLRDSAPARPGNEGRPHRRTADSSPKNGAG